jgi:hypothetical protein
MCVMLHMQVGTLMLNAGGWILKRGMKRGPRQRSCTSADQVLRHTAIHALVRDARCSPHHKIYESAYSTVTDSTGL